MTLLRAVRALATRELLRFFRQRSRVVGAVLPPLVMWALVGSGFGASFRLPGANAGASGEAPGGALAYFFPGAVVLVVLFASAFSTISVIEDRHEGFLQGVLVSPAPPLAVVLGKVLGGSALGLLQGGAFLLLLPLTGLRPSASGLLVALAALALVALGLTALSFALAWLLDSTQGFHAVLNVLLVPMWLVSGAFFPLQGAPRWLSLLMILNPLAYGVAAFRRGLDPRTSEGLPSFGVSVGVSALFAAAALAASAAVVRRGAESDRRKR